MTLTAAAVLVVSGPTLAGNHDKKSKDKGKGAAQEMGAGQTAAGMVTAPERAIFESYMKKGKLPAGFKDAKPLPPGIAKKLQRGGTLPPGIAKRYPPPDLMRQLPPRPGQEWIVAGHDIVLIDAATHLIIDVLHGLF